MQKRLAAALITIGAVGLLTSIGHLATAAQGRQIRRRNTQVIAARWYTFTSPDRDFTLDFPREPKREQDNQGPVTLIRAYGLNTDDGMRFSVNFQDVGGYPRSNRNNEFAPDYEETVAAAARREGRRVVQIHRLAKNVVEMELWQTVEESKANLNYLERDILWRGRVYTLGCGSLVDGREVDKSICRRFFNSMRLAR
ncbi:MAG: hypothetical protein M3444_02510 [Acidobacteriota bacterium]|nr:hypothetical protein [Acidobacteriota bacterium]